MKKSNRSRQQQTEWKQKPLITVGIDLGDRWSHYCMLNADGEVVEQGRVASTEAGIRRQFEGESQQRVAMECGTHSPWISRLLSILAIR
jgi:transposase